MDHPELIYVTPAARGLKASPTAEVRVILSKDMPEPFWSRAGRKKTCTLDLDAEPATIERAELRVLIWDGGAGTVKDYFTLNGRPLPVARSGKHDVIYSGLDLDPKLLHKGANRIDVVSDTEHHGLEVLMPGPALIVRTGTTSRSPSALATSPPPQCRTMSISPCAATSRALAAPMVSALR